MTSQKRHIPQEFVLSTPAQWRDLGEKLEKVDRELVLDSSDILVLQGERTKAAPHNRTIWPHGNTTDGTELS